MMCMVTRWRKGWHLRLSLVVKQESRLVPYRYPGEPAIADELININEQITAQVAKPLRKCFIDRCLLFVSIHSFSITINIKWGKYWKTM